MFKKKWTALGTCAQKIDEGRIYSGTGSCVGKRRKEIKGSTCWTGKKKKNITVTIGNFPSCTFCYSIGRLFLLLSGNKIDGKKSDLPVEEDYFKLEISTKMSRNRCIDLIFEFF